MLSLSEIHMRIENLSGQLEDLVSDITKAAQAAAEDEAAFKGAFAKARLNTRAEWIERNLKFTVDIIEDCATEETADLRHAYLLSANNLLVLREALRARQAQLDGYRTLAASYRGAGG